jgi:hypothetical protein
MAGRFSRAHKLPLRETPVREQDLAVKSRNPIAQADAAQASMGGPSTTH